MTDTDQPVQQQREQLLKLVAKSFYRELAKYGVARNELLAVTNHLLEALLRDGGGVTSPKRSSEELLSIGNVSDTWRERQTLSFAGVSIRPLRQQDIAPIVAWLEDPAVRDSFIPALPDEPPKIQQYFSDPSRRYLAILNGEDFVGGIGADSIDLTNRKIEMKKFVGDRAFRGIGIGTRATFAFLYYAFMLLDVHKVYLYSHDTNIQNLNLNSRLGFELEGIFLEEFKHGERLVDVVRMGLLKPLWLALFGD